MIANIFGPDLGIVVVIIIVVLLGGSQLPKIARNVGTAGREFRKAQQEAEEDAERDRAAKVAAQARSAVAPPPPIDAPGTSPGEPSITLSRSELDALLKAREDQARRETAGPAN
jgi:sec-independent protein translocase protein TatA